jgi:hypothetical protein
MGHCCRICGRTRANERFSGRGHSDHVCKDCKRRPKAERRAIEEEEEITGYLHQSNISEKNLRRLERLSVSGQERTMELARLVLAVARIAPSKRRRLRIVGRTEPLLLRALDDAGLLF